MSRVSEIRKFTDKLFEAVEGLTTLGVDYRAVLGENVGYSKSHKSNGEIILDVYPQDKQHDSTKVPYWPADLIEDQVNASAQLARLPSHVTIMDPEEFESYRLASEKFVTVSNRNIVDHGELFDEHYLGKFDGTPRKQEPLRIIDNSREIANVKKPAPVVKVPAKDNSRLRNDSPKEGGKNLVVKPNNDQRPSAEVIRNGQKPDVKGKGKKYSDAVKSDVKKTVPPVKVVSNTNSQPPKNSKPAELKPSVKQTMPSGLPEAIALNNRYQLLQEAASEALKIAPPVELKNLAMDVKPAVDNAGKSASLDVKTDELPPIEPSSVFTDPDNYV